MTLFSYHALRSSLISHTWRRPPLSVAAKISSKDVYEKLLSYAEGKPFNFMQSFYTALWSVRHSPLHYY